MPDKLTCEECGAELPANAPQGLCPRCLAGMGLSLLPTVEPAESDLQLECPGKMIGRYKLLEKFGEGGFGVVFMAEQVEPVQRKVALKIIKAGMDTKEVIARFEAERQAIALMDHPNIARALDAGATEAGRPYFVMELVRGIPITDYCDRENLPTRERLQLFMKVCQAVQHAHQKGVIHRDIKPSNVLVTEHDDEPVPKVIDFGVAKALGQKLTAKTLFTAFNHMIGTPAYMSPEQAALSGLDIDTRADVYSLGVLLYELLTGVTPFDAETFRKAGLDEIRRMIRETEPPKPSTRLQTLGEKLTDVAMHRATEPAALNRLVRGDLDWIVMRCLEKDRKRRYETANGLAADLQRHLDCEPVLACPPSRLYEFQKTVRRHKVGFAATGAVVVALLAGLGLSTWALLKEKASRRTAETAEAKATLEASRAAASKKIADEQRQRAEKALINEETQRRQAEQAALVAKIEAKKSREVSAFLEEMVRGAGPYYASGRDTTLLRAIADQAAARLETGLKDEPEVRIELMGILIEIYVESESPGADVMARKRVELSKSVYGETNAVYAEALSQCAQVLGGEEGEKLALQAITIFTQVGGTNNPAIAGPLRMLAGRVRAQSKFTESADLLRRAVSIQKSHGIRDPRFLKDLAAVLIRMGKLDEAEPLAEESVAIQRTYGNDHLSLSDSLGDLATLRLCQGKMAEAEALRSESLSIRKKNLPDGSFRVNLALLELARVHALQGRFEEAESMVRETLAAQTNRYGEEHYLVAITAGRLAAILREEGKLEDAERAVQRSLSIFEKIHSQRWQRFESQSLLGEILFLKEDYRSAETALLEAYGGLRKYEQTIYFCDRDVIKQALQRLLHFYEATGDTRKATEWRQKYTEYQPTPSK